MVLMHKTSIVPTYTSDYAIGGVLTELHPDNTEHTIDFASQSLNSLERK